MTTTPCPTEERPPVVALLRRVYKKAATKKWMPDTTEQIIRVGEVQPAPQYGGRKVWKWTQTANRAEFKGATAEHQAREFAKLLLSGVTRDSGATCNLDRGMLAKDLPLWKRVESVEVVG